MTSPSSERLQFVLDAVNGGAVVNELQRIGAAGENSQTRLQQRVGDTERAFVAQGRAGGSSLAVISDGADRSTSMLSRMSDRLGVTESTLRTGIATAATVGFGVLISKAADAINQYIDLAGQVRTFQRASGASAEESSRFVAVLDDLQISAEQGSQALGKLARVDASKLAQFGIEVARTSEGTVSLTETLLNVADAYAATDDPQQRALLGNAAFGRSYQTLIPLLEQGRAGLRAYFDGVSEGQILSQEQLASAREYELALDSMQDAMGDLSRAAGENLVPALTNLLNAGAGIITMLGAIPGPLVESAVSAVAFSVAAAGLTRGLNALRGVRAAEALASTATSVTNLGVAAAAATGPADKLGRTAAGLNRVGVAGAAIGASLPILGELYELLRGTVVEDVDVDRLATSLENLAATGGSGGVFDDMGGLEGFKQSLSDTIETAAFADSTWARFTGMSSLIRQFDQGTEEIKATDEALALLVRDGKTDAAAEAFRQLARAAEEQGVPIERLREMFPEYAEAVEDAALAEESATGATNEHGEAMSKAEEKASTYTAAMEELQKAFDAVSGRAISLAEADIAARDALADFTQAVRENIEAGESQAVSLDRTTQLGRDNESMLLDQITAAQNLATATAEQTGSTQQAEEAFRTQIGAIRDNMIALGFNAGQVDALIGRYARVPSRVTTRADLEDAASGGVDKLAAKLRSLDGSKATVKVTSIFEGVQTGGSAPKGKATGGAIAAGTDYVVGEVRPELFRSAVPGTIVPTTGVSSSSAGRDSPLMQVENLTVRSDRDIDDLLDAMVYAGRTGGKP